MHHPQCKPLYKPILYDYWTRWARSKKILFWSIVFNGHAITQSSSSENIDGSDSNFLQAAASFDEHRISNNFLSAFTTSHNGSEEASSLEEHARHFPSETFSDVNTEAERQPLDLRVKRKLEEENPAINQQVQCKKFLKTSEKPQKLSFQLLVQPYFTNNYGDVDFKEVLRNGLRTQNSSDMHVLFAPSCLPELPNKQYILGVSSRTTRKKTNSQKYGEYDLKTYSIFKNQQVLLYVKSRISKNFSVISENHRDQEPAERDYTYITIKYLDNTTIKVIAVNFHYIRTGQEKRDLLIKIKKEQITDGKFDYLFLIGCFETLTKSDLEVESDNWAQDSFKEFMEILLKTIEVEENINLFRRDFRPAKYSCSQTETKSIRWESWLIKILVYRKFKTEDKTSKLQLDNYRFKYASKAKILKGILDGKIVYE